MWLHERYTSFLYFSRAFLVFFCFLLPAWKRTGGGWIGGRGGGFRASARVIRPDCGRGGGRVGLDRRR